MPCKQTDTQLQLSSYHLCGRKYLGSQDRVEVVGDGMKNELAVEVGSASMAID